MSRLAPIEGDRPNIIERSWVKSGPRNSFVVVRVNFFVPFAQILEYLVMFWFQVLTCLRVVSNRIIVIWQVWTCLIWVTRIDMIVSFCVIWAFKDTFTHNLKFKTCFEFFAFLSFCLRSIYERSWTQCFWVLLSQKWLFQELRF